MNKLYNELVSHYFSDKYYESVVQSAKFGYNCGNEL